MSFSVKAGESPSPQQSPYMHPYVSPQILPQSNLRIPPMSLNDEHVVSKRVGTDPTKYKTTICRNWEQTGTCTFRGCTFAHGVEELRAPTRIDHGGTPLLHSQYVSPSGTPLLMATSSGAGSTNHLANGTPPRLESLLELLQTEVSREREFVSVHMEANRTLEGMLRREQLEHAETKALLDKTRAEYDVLADVVSQQNALLQTLLEQHGTDSAHLANNKGSAQSVEKAKALVQRITSLFQGEHAYNGAADATTAAPVVRAPNSEEEESDSSAGSNSGSAADNTKNKETERIEELLRALQQPQHS